MLSINVVAISITIITIIYDLYIYIYIKKIIYKVWLNKIKISKFILNKNNAINTEIIIINNNKIFMSEIFSLIKNIIR